jgi:hypothetical protein
LESGKAEILKKIRNQFDAVLISLSSGENSENPFLGREAKRLMNLLNKWIDAAPYMQ